MEKIVYILGAGFSAPAGLPLMNNFRLKAIDMYYANTEKYAYFKKIFEKIEELSKIKNFFSCDLYNIEEVLSIFETQAILDRNIRFKKEFIQFIIDVIEYYTLKPYRINPPDTVNYHQLVLNGGEKFQRLFSCFFCNILGIMLRQIRLGVKDYELRIERIPDNNTRYSIITLNYDTIPETSIESIKSGYGGDHSINYNKDSYDSNWRNPHLVKLHGCIKTKDIIPPTWSKSTTKKIIESWKNAYNIIKDATEIRILGYSLPITDTNVRYLIKSAIIKNTRLHKIDVICLDNEEHQLESNYRNFIDFNYFNFKHFDLSQYLLLVHNSSLEQRGFKDGVYFNSLERIHRQVIEQ